MTSLKMRVPVPFPASVSGSGAVTVTKTNGVWTVALDFSQFADAAISDTANTRVLVYDAASSAYDAVTIDTLIAAVPAITISGHAVKGGDSLNLAQADIAGLTTADTPTFAGLGGNPTVATQAATDNSTKIATTAFVKAIGPVFDTKAALVAATVASILNGVYIRGYYAAGDLGAGFYKRAGAAPSHAAYIQSADGAYWVLEDAEPKAAQLGVKGDSTTDDTTALNNWLIYLSAVSCPGLLVGTNGVVFKTTANLVVYPNTVVRGTGWSCTIKSAFNGNIFTPYNMDAARTNNVKLSNFAVDGTSKVTYPASYAFYLKNASEWWLEYILISNVHTGVDIFNTGSGGLDASNYNTCNRVVVNTADNGFVFEALANSNRVINCRTVSVTTCATDSGDQNNIRDNTFETFTTGVRGLSTSDTLLVKGNRFEGGTTGIKFDSGSVNPKYNDNYFSSVTTKVDDASTNSHTNFKVVSFTADISLSTNVAVTGIGFRPSAIVFFATVANAAGQFSFGVTDGGTSGTIMGRGNIAADTMQIDTTCFEIITSSGNNTNFGLSSLDNDGFTLTRVVTGTPTGTATIKAICMR